MSLIAISAVRIGTAQPGGQKLPQAARPDLGKEVFDVVWVIKPDSVAQRRHVISASVTVLHRRFARPSRPAIQNWPISRRDNIPSVLVCVLFNLHLKVSVMYFRSRLGLGVEDHADVFPDHPEAEQLESRRASRSEGRSKDQPLHGGAVAQQISA